MPTQFLGHSPGTGKSALLARLVTTADRSYRIRIPDLCDNDAPAGTFDVTFYAKGQTVSDFVEHVAAMLGLSLSASTAAALNDGVREAKERWVLAIDAIDESAEPKALCELLNTLGGLGCKVLVGCREHLLDALSDPGPLHLDRSPYLELADIDGYVEAILREHDGVDRGLIAEISEAAQGNFLVAQLIARAVTLSGVVVRPLPRNVAQAFDGLLDALPDPAFTRELLLALAYGKGDGLPARLWQTAASALSRPCHGADIDGLLRGPAASFLITRVGDPGGSRHRLFHDALAETLTRSRDTSADHVLLWETWKAHVADNDGWASASAYLLVHGAEHAADAGALGALAGDVSYLLHADLVRLAIQGASHPAGDAGAIARTGALLRLAATRLQPLRPTERARLIALAASHLGLGSLARDALARIHDGWRPRWAHRLGDAYQPLAGHAGWVYGVAIGSAGGRAFIASAGKDETVRMWDAVSGEPIGEPLTGHTAAVNAVAIGSAGGRAVIVSAGKDQPVRIWDAVSGEPIGEPLTGHTDSVNAVAIGSAAGQAFIASGSTDDTIRIWSAVSGELVGDALDGHTGGVLGVAIDNAADQSRVVSASWDQTVRIWDAVSGKPIGDALRGHTDSVNAVAFGPRDATR